MPPGILIGHSIIKTQTPVIEEEGMRIIDDEGNYLIDDEGEFIIE
jgi:hypothetical protein